MSSPEIVIINDMALVRYTEYERMQQLENVAFKVILKENEKLKAQIEKMKCCGNCKHQNVLKNDCEFIANENKMFWPCNKWEFIGGQAE